MKPERVNVENLGKLPAFSHAVVAGGLIYVSGTLGTRAKSFELVEGGTGPQTEQTLRNIEMILQASGASLADLVKVNVYLSDMQTFPEMNEAYLRVIGDDPPARITVGGGTFALGAAVEIDCVAYKPDG
jgi:2-iminobutanoate/2-iminopropanoate deaminase